MKRTVFFLFLVLTAVVPSVGYEWQTEEEVKEIREGIERQLPEGSEYPIQAVAVCKDMEDMADACRVEDMRRYFQTVTMMGYEPVGELYLVMYMQYGRGFPRIVASVYRMDGTIEWYFVD